MLARLLRIVRPHGLSIFIGSVLFAVATFAELRLPAVGGALLDHYTKHAGEGTDVVVPPSFYREIAHVVMCFATMAIAKHVGEYFLKLAGERAVCDIRIRLFGGLMATEVSALDETPSASLVSTLTSDVDAIHLSLTLHAPLLMRNLCMCLVSVSHMAVLSPRLTALTASCAPVLSLLAHAMHNVVKRIAHEQQRQLAATAALAAEALASARCVKAFGREATVCASYAREVRACRVLAMREMLVHKVWNTLNLLVPGLATLLIMREAGRDVLRGHLSTGDAISFAAYGLTIGHAADAAARAWQSTSSGLARARVAIELLDAEEARAKHAADTDRRLASRHGLSTAEATAASLPTHVTSLPVGTARADVRVADVVFAYARRASPAALGGVSFELAADRVMALVGPSGSGKSTILSLLLRFYAPSSGTITFGGVELSELPNAWLRANLGIVAQEPTLFRTSLHENIAFGALPDAVEMAEKAKDASADAAASRALAPDELVARRVRAAAVAANAHEFIVEAGGYDVQVGERGGNLSGGQRQRIAIARALMRDPSVLLLDEATASLDASSERHIQTALATLTRGRATLIVAHRLATVRDANEIVVLERGRVVERGTHAALVASGGLYARLSALQHLEVQAAEGGAH